MRKMIEPLVVWLALSGAAIAEDRPNSAHTPPQSPFTASGSETLAPPNYNVIQYRGRTTLQAKYRFVYFNENDDDAPGYDQNPYLVLLPDSESQLALPYLTRWVYQSDASKVKALLTEKADEIWVSNVADAAVALLGKSLAADVLAGKHETITGEAVVVIDGFSAGYECDNPSFSTRFVEVKRAMSAPLTAKREVGGC